MGLKTSISITVTMFCNLPKLTLHLCVIENVVIEFNIIHYILFFLKIP